MRARPQISDPSGIDADGAALSLLSAAAFSIHSAGNADAAITWSDSESAARLWRCSPERLPSHSDDLTMRLSHEAQRERRKAIKSLTWDGAQYRVTYEISGPDGQSLWVEERGQRHNGAGDDAHIISAVISDIHSVKAAQDTARYAATRDSLTGLWHRERMADEAAQLIAMAARKIVNPGLLGLRMTNLADINAGYGYSAGDSVLSMAAERLRGWLQAPDTLGRLGGSSFILGICDADRDAMQTIGETLSELLSGEGYQTMSGHITARFDALAAVKLRAEDGGPETAEQALNYLDVALTHSQSETQGFTYYHADMTPMRAAQRDDKFTQDDILGALNDRRISLAYQPIVHAETLDIHHYECLLRLQAGNGEIVSAGHFIMAAETLGLVHLLDRRAVELARETLLSDSQIAVALNVSAATVMDDENAADYLASIRSLGAMSSRVTIELTETVALDDPSKAAQFANEARALGCQFAIDDFGSGYTSFRNLMAIEADAIKIDGSFIQDLSVTPYKQTFIRMMVDLAQTFGVETVAEMVNTKEDASLLKRLGVNYLQGYMFGVPSPMPTIQRQAG